MGEIHRTNRRKFSRVEGVFPVRLRVENPRLDILSSITAETIDVSEGGLSVFLDLPLPFQSIVSVQMDLSPDYSPLRGKMEVAWSKFLVGHRFRSGMRFLEVEDKRQKRLKQLIEEVSLLKSKREPAEVKRQAQLEIRSAKFEDIDEILQVEQEVWPEGLSATREMIQSRLETFPEGFLCAFVQGKMKGFMVTEFLNYDLQKDGFSWCEVSDYGYIRKTHNPKGDSIYGVSLSVSPQSHFKEIAAPLIENGLDLAVKCGLKQAVFGCRIPRYHKYADKMSVAEYIYVKTKAGRSLDPELEMYQKIAFRIVKPLPNYMEDPESLNYGVLLAWGNPFFNMENTLRFWKNHRTSSLIEK